MNGNGRLTAPPEFKAVLVTNSVYGTMSEGRSSRPATGSSTLASFSPKTRTREARYVRGRKVQGLEASMDQRSSIQSVQQMPSPPVPPLPVYP